MRKDIVSLFAKSITVKKDAINSLNLSKKEEVIIRGSIDEDIKKVSDFAIPRVSKKAKEKSTAMGIDLLSMNWHNQTKKSFDPGRKLFHWEHIVPVSQIRKMCLEAKNEDEVKTLLLEKISVAWILKEEDKKLTKSGFRSERPDPKEAYFEAGIELIE